VKPVVFPGDSLQLIKSFPRNARQDIGFQLDALQRGDMPDNWKPFSEMARGVQEIRITDRGGQFRVIFVSRFSSAVYVLHAFQKKSQKTRQSDIDLARKRFAEIREFND
jgi:phage-related protein